MGNKLCGRTRPDASLSLPLSLAALLLGPSAAPTSFGSSQSSLSGSPQTPLLHHSADLPGPGRRLSAPSAAMARSTGFHVFGPLGELEPASTGSSLRRGDGGRGKGGDHGDRDGRRRLLPVRRMPVSQIFIPRRDNPCRLRRRLACSLLPPDLTSLARHARSMQGQSTKSRPIPYSLRLLA
ncbi:hypothetical protein CDD83_8316 [Cordyceps sp. RAO-2017]|nr:hypothetical protein CDD83_8316 [Cordyceps sp. RAO-2017]